MNKIIRILSLLIALVFTVSIFTGCVGSGPDTQGKEMITIQWVQGQKLLKEEIVEKGTVLESWTPEVEGMEFQGWYERPYIKKFDFTKPVKNSMKIYASFKSLSGGDGEGDGEYVVPDWYLIGAGKGDLGTRVVVSGKDEVVAQGAVGEELLELLSREGGECHRQCGNKAEKSFHIGVG